MSLISAAGAALGLLLAVAGVAGLRFAWRRPKPLAPTVMGWLLLAAGAAAWKVLGGWDQAWAFALLAPSPIALGFVVAGCELRQARSARPARAPAELPPRSGEAWWRGSVRILYAGPLSGGCALLLAAGWALHGVGSAAERMAVALLLAPLLWAAGLVWSTTDAKLLRIGGGLLALGLAGGLAAAA